MSRLLSLDEPDALEIDRVGAKVARLAEARQHGFDVLPGLVVESTESRRSIEAGQAALVARNAGAARIAAFAAGVSPGLGRALARTSELGRSLVVRSSTRLDGDGAWSGAFASFLEVGPDGLDVAVCGCYASLFTPDVLARFEQAGIGPASVDMAVLVQPFLEPVVGGWTRVVDGSVEVAAIAGSPARLFAGWERGWRCVVSADGGVQTGQPAGLLDRPTLARVAELARRACHELDAGRLEWAFVDGRVVILQLDPIDWVSGATDAEPAFPESLAGAPFRRLARVLLGRSGRLADGMLVPWAAAAPDTWQIAAVHGTPLDLFEEAKRLSHDLAALVVKSTGLTTEQLIDGLDAADASVAARLSEPTVDGAMVGWLLGAVDRVGEQLTGSGLLRAPEAIWWQSVDWVDDALRSAPPRPAARWLGDRWAHLVQGVTVVNGQSALGAGASDGWAAGPARFISRSTDVQSFRSRDILVVERPLQMFAPLLWNAAALVCRNGSPAAHLCDVARSLRLPAVVSSDLPRLTEDTAAALDGRSGTVWWWQPTGVQTIAGPGS